MNLVGSWHLMEWDCFIDDLYHNHPFGREARGNLIYTADGFMSAILMRANRLPFAIPNLARGTTEEKDAAITSYVSYGGTYRIEGEQVIHMVSYSLLPNWLGIELPRQMQWTDSGELILSTPAEATMSGRMISHRLRWAKQ